MLNILLASASLFKSHFHSSRSSSIHWKGRPFPCMYAYLNSDGRGLLEGPFGSQLIRMHTCAQDCMHTAVTIMGGYCNMS